MNLNSKKILSFIAIFLFTLLIIAATWVGLKNLQAQQGTEIFVSFIVNLVGIFVGAGLAYWFALNQFEIQSKNLEEKALADKAFELYEEFNSPEMLRMRIAADKLIRQKPNVPLIDLYEQSGGEETFSIWLIAGFYEKLWITIDHQKIDVSYIPPFFGEKFYWWYIVCFEERLIPSELKEMSTHIKNLKLWFDSYSSLESRTRWINRANNEKD